MCICLISIIFGPWYSEPGYDWLRHSISELAAQHTDNAWVMRLGLFSLGSGVILGFRSDRAKYNVLFLCFGVFIALSALFPHKPFIPGRPYSQTLDFAHSLCASIGGFSAVLGFVVLALRAETGARRAIYVTFATAYTVLPMAMLAFADLQGLFQRTIFISFIAWVMIDPGPRESR